MLNPDHYSLPSDSPKWCIFFPICKLTYPLSQTTAVLSHYRILSKSRLFSGSGADVDSQILIFKFSSQIYIFFQSGNLWTKETSRTPLPLKKYNGRRYSHNIFRGQVVRGILEDLQIKRKIISLCVLHHKERSSIPGRPLWALKKVYYKPREKSSGLYNGLTKAVSAA